MLAIFVISSIFAAYTNCAQTCQYMSIVSVSEAQVLVVEQDVERKLEIEGMLKAAIMAAAIGK